MKAPTRRLNVAGAASRRPAPAQRIPGRLASFSTAFEKDEEEIREVGAMTFEPGEEPAFVKVNVGMTKNLGNFESLRLDVQCTLPCHVDETEDAYQRASDFVAEKLQLELDSWLGTTPQKATRK